MRQVGLVDRNGQSAAWSGKDCTAWFGHITGADYAVQGNMLVGEPTIQAMAEAFESASALELPERLLTVLEAGQAAGGDKRGRQSAALKVVHQEEYPYLDLRVDEHRHPVAELRRVFEVARHQYLPFIVGMPTRARPAGQPARAGRRHAPDAAAVPARRRRLGLSTADQPLCGKRVSRAAPADRAAPRRDAGARGWHHRAHPSRRTRCLHHARIGTGRGGKKV